MCIRDSSGTATLKDAVSETMREWTNRIADTHYVLGSVMGPHPFPTIVRDFQAVISDVYKRQALEADLLQDEKELAEHNMLVDLGRNDIGKISELGSVKVEKYLTVERYSCVMHLGSTVTGTIKKGKDAIDADVYKRQAKTPYTNCEIYFSPAARFAIILSTVANCQQLFLLFFKKFRIIFFYYFIGKKGSRNRNFYFGSLFAKSGKQFGK